MEIFVAFTDAAGQTIGASFSCAQDPDVWPHQGVIEDTDARWTCYAAQFSPGTFNSRSA